MLTNSNLLDQDENCYTGPHLGPSVEREPDLKLGYEFGSRIEPIDQRHLLGSISLFGKLSLVNLNLRNSP